MTVLMTWIHVIVMKENNLHAFRVLRKIVFLETTRVRYSVRKFGVKEISTELTVNIKKGSSRSLE